VVHRQEHQLHHNRNRRDQGLLKLNDPLPFNWSPTESEVKIRGRASGSATCPYDSGLFPVTRTGGIAPSGPISAIFPDGPPGGTPTGLVREPGQQYVYENYDTLLVSLLSGRYSGTIRPYLKLSRRYGLFDQIGMRVRCGTERFATTCSAAKCTRMLGTSHG